MQMHRLGTLTIVLLLFTLSLIFFVGFTIFTGTGSGYISSNPQHIQAAAEN